MSVGAVAERYAQALFELASEAGQATQLADKLRAFAEAYESSKELPAALANPSLNREQRHGIVKSVAQKLGVNDLGVKGLLLMSDRGRLPAIAATARRLTEMCDEKDGVLRASVTTATKMPESYYASLTSQLQSSTKKKIVLEKSVDESLVGGAVARVGDSVIDGSVRGQLEKVERDLLAAVASGVS